MQVADKVAVTEAEMAAAAVEVMVVERVAEDGGGGDGR